MKKIYIGAGRTVHIKRKGARNVALCGGTNNRGWVGSEIHPAEDDAPVNCKKCLASLEVLKEKHRREQAQTNA